jgi:hypothetical protein
MPEVSLEPMQLIKRAAIALAKKHIMYSLVGITGNADGQELTK